MASADARRAQADAATAKLISMGGNVAGMLPLLTPVMRIVAARLADLTADGSRSYRSTIAELGRQCLVSVRAVQAACRVLQQQGFLRVIEERVNEVTSLPNIFLVSASSLVQGGRSNARGVQKSAAKSQELISKTTTTSTNLGCRSKFCSQQIQAPRVTEVPAAATPTGPADIEETTFLDLAAYAVRQVAPDALPGLNGQSTAAWLAAVEDLLKSRIAGFSLTAYHRVAQRRPLVAALSVLEALVVSQRREASSRYRPIANLAAYLSGILFNRTTGPRPQDTLGRLVSTDTGPVTNETRARPPATSASTAGSGRCVMLTKTDMLRTHADPMVRQLAGYGPATRLDVVKRLNKLRGAAGRALLSLTTDLETIVHAIREQDCARAVMP
ncbi:hypothetical protein GE253_22955 [Niveispirillum sp. SYP-B3756]|uniref:hypothetical protein n=1 Tax=Niveispirillum sp. SYP-B3756 TaxID=2662178 RepID=UPI001291257A|nr:hypothetical protein [Niveispirillum sp. SYP-B3756]MQP68182.1 hypothetical protein [Niveispirillum sp. SYP-B3756]